MQVSKVAPPKHSIENNYLLSAYGYYDYSNYIAAYINSLVLNLVALRLWWASLNDVSVNIGLSL